MDSLPASHLALEYVEDLSTFVGQTMDVRVITVEKEKKKLVLSARDVLREREAEKLNQKIAMLSPGTVLEGKVESLMPYGAFVNLGNGISGLVHISQISRDRFLKHPLRSGVCGGYCEGGCAGGRREEKTHFPVHETGGVIAAILFRMR